MTEPFVAHLQTQVDSMERRVGDLEAAHVWLTAYIVSLEQDLNEFTEPEADPNQATWTPAQAEGPYSMLARDPRYLDLVNVKLVDGAVKLDEATHPSVPGPKPLPASVEATWGRLPGDDQPVDTAESVQADKDPVDVFIEENGEGLD